MTLTYLPFRTSERITMAAKNAPPMRWGERGRGVAVLQQALVDHGYALPRSTNAQGMLDGIYGREMFNKISFFQARNNLGVDGVAGRNTIACLDHLMSTGVTAQPSKAVTLHFRSLSLTTVPFERQFRNAQLVYAQYNIEVRFGSGQSLGLTEEEAEKYQQIDGQCRWVVRDDEFAELQGLGPPVPANDIAVYYVNRFSRPTLLGCGGHRPNRPACIVASQATEWSLSHEVGHVLLTSSFSPVHHPSTQNLMFSSTASITRDVPALDNSQLARIRSSPLVR